MERNPFSCAPFGFAAWPLVGRLVSLTKTGCAASSKNERVGPDRLQDRRPVARKRLARASRSRGRRFA